MRPTRDSVLQQLTIATAAIATSTPGLIAGDKLAAVIGLGGTLGVSVVENIRARYKRLDEEVKEAFEDERLKNRFDENVKADEFIALYVRARDTAAKSEKEQKLRYIRNFLVNSMIVPTSNDPDKERYLRLIDELSFREHELLLSFLRLISPSSGAGSFEEWLKNPRKTGGMLGTLAAHLLGVPAGTSSAVMNDLVDELIVSFRHLYSAGLLDAVTLAGEMVHFDTNGFTPKFIRFVVEPF